MLDPNDDPTIPVLTIVASTFNEPPLLTEIIKIDESAANQLRSQFKNSLENPEYSAKIRNSCHTEIQREIEQALHFTLNEVVENVRNQFQLQIPLLTQQIIQNLQIENN